MPQNEVVQEYPVVGKYRIRILKDPKSETCTLDIREYVLADAFEGFTRRGIRIAGRAQIETLKTALEDILSRNLVT